MKFLIDTNILIPLEPTSPSNVTATTPQAAELARIVQTANHQMFVHPDQRLDIERDTDEKRRGYRKVLFEKYPVLPTAPSAPREITSLIGRPPKGSNDWVDNQLIVALYRDAVDYIVTEDKHLRNKAARLGLQARVLTLGEALRAVQVLFEKRPPAPPPVRGLAAYELNHFDSFFDSFRSDYGAKVFNKWITKCKRKHRLAWIIEGRQTPYAAVSIVKLEEEENLGLEGRILKICSLKVSMEYSGFHYAELLLKTIFEYALVNSFDYLFVDIYPKYDVLIGILKDHGFGETAEKKPTGEVRLVKQLTFATDDLERFEALEFNRRFGPYSFKLSNVCIHLVPIKPEFHQLLFPDAETELFPGFNPFGNGIRKAYLCNAPIRSLKPGDVLLFYSSGKRRAVTTTGVVEDTTVGRDADKIARFVGKRTIYSYKEIRHLCKRDVLAILFRHSGVLSEPLRFNTLKQHNVLSCAPQSIQSVPRESLKWLRRELTARLPFYRSAPSMRT